MSGEPAEQSALGGRFGAIITNYLQLVFRRKWLLAFTALYGQISPIIPYIFAAPFYFAGKIQLGVMTQTAGAFSRVEGALTFFVNYYASLANFKSVVDRLTSFIGAIDRAKALAATGPARSRRQRRRLAVAIEDLDVALPDGRRIVDAERLSFEAGESALLAGPSGSGKSTLFRAHLRHLAVRRGPHPCSRRRRRDGDAAEALYPDRHVARRRLLSGRARRL